MLKKILSVILSAVMAVSVMSVAVGAQEVHTASVMQEYGATATRWNGKTQLRSGKTYAVTSNVTVAKKIVIPADTTLIVMKGAKLWVSGNGSLFVQGKLTVKSGGTLAVTGRLYQYKGKSILNYGEMRFANKANVTLNGKTTVYASGSISGKPKTLSVGADATISCKGSNNCPGLEKYIDRTDMAAGLDSFFTKAIQKSDIYGAVKLVMSAEYISDLDKALAAAGGSFEALCDAFEAEYVAALKEEGIEPSQVKSITVKLTGLTEEKPADELYTLAQKYYKNAQKYYTADCEITVKTASGTYTEEAELSMVKHSGKWYLLG